MFTTQYSYRLQRVPVRWTRVTGAVKETDQSVRGACCCSCWLPLVRLQYYERRVGDVGGGATNDVGAGPGGGGGGQLMANIIDVARQTRDMTMTRSMTS